MYSFELFHFRHDIENSSWSKIVVWTSLSYKRIDLSSIIPKVAESAVIHEVPGIKRAFVDKNTEGVLTLHTEGSYGIWELFKHDTLLDLNKLYSNDVQAVAENYGIEAANRVIVREVQDVFKVSVFLFIYFFYLSRGCVIDFFCIVLGVRNYCRSTSFIANCRLHDI